MKITNERVSQVFKDIAVGEVFGFIDPRYASSHKYCLKISENHYFNFDYKCMSPINNVNGPVVVYDAKLVIK